MLGCELALARSKRNLGGEARIHLSLWTRAPCSSRDGLLLCADRQQTHLFDIDIPGKITFQESATLTAGGSGTVVDTEVGRLGIGICFDVRFPDLAAVYAARGAHFLIFPGANRPLVSPRCRGHTLSS